MKETFSVLAGFLSIIAYVPYIRAIVKGYTKPAKASWIIWASIDTITFYGMYIEDTLNGQIIATVIGVWLIAALALKYGSRGWTKIDKSCLGGTVLSILLWQMFNSPTLGIVASVSAGSIGSIPTCAAAWNDPGRENKLAWTIFFVSCVLTVIAMPHWTWADATQPISFLVIGITMMYILYLRPRLLIAA